MLRSSDGFHIRGRQFSLCALLVLAMGDLTACSGKSPANKPSLEARTEPDKAKKPKKPALGSKSAGQAEGDAKQSWPQGIARERQSPGPDDGDPTREPSNLGEMLARDGASRHAKIRAATAKSSVAALMGSEEAKPSKARSTCADLRSGYADHRAAQAKKALPESGPDCSGWSPARLDCALRVLEHGKYADRRRLDELWHACARHVQAK